jgi:hypothetical protein
VVYRQCLHQFPDGQQCKAKAVKGKTRCRHHQPNLAKRNRITRSEEARQARLNKFVGSKARQMLRAPFQDSAAQLERWRELGVLTPDLAKLLRYGLQVYKANQREVEALRENKSFGSARQSI